MSQDLLHVPSPDLLAAAASVRDATTGTRITWSPKVFIPLTMLCRDKCGYCTFAKAPARLESPYLSPNRSSTSPGPEQPPVATRRCSPWENDPNCAIRRRPSG